MRAWFVQKTNRSVLGVAFLTALLLLFGWIGANAQSPNATGQPSLVSPSPYNRHGCHAYFDNLKRGLLPHGGSWTEAEEKVLDVLCDGVRYSRPPDAPLVVLTSTFIQALVESNQFDAPGYAGISIDGVEVSENLQLIRLQINNTVSITNSKFLGTVDLGYSSTTHNLDFTGSSFLKRLCLTGFSSTQSVFISDSQPSKLGNDSREGDNIQDSTEEYKCYQTTDTESYISLNFARIDGLVSIRGVDGLGEAVKGLGLSAVSARIGQFLKVENSKFKTIDLQGLSGGELDIVNTKVRGAEGCTPESLDGIRITGAVYLSRTSFFCGLTMSGAQIGSGLSLLGTEIHSLDLTGTRISGDLEIGDYREPDGTAWFVGWPDDASIPQVILAHASANVLKVALQNWPGLENKDTGKNGSDLSYCAQPKIDENGSIVKSLYELVESSANALSDWFRFGISVKPDPRFVINDFQFKAFGLPTFCRLGDTLFTETDLHVEDLQKWLSAAQFSPSEFDWVQGLLLSSGQPSQARRLAFMKSSIAEGQSWKQVGTWPIAISQAASRLLIGYGYCLYASAIWAFLLWALGTLIFYRIPPENVVAKDGALITDVSPFTYSFDMLLPVIRLREKHYDLDIKGWQRRYFYLHKIMGFVIGLFIVAGLSGLAH